MCVQDGTDCDRDGDGGRFLRILEPREILSCLSGEEGVLNERPQDHQQRGRTKKGGGGLGVFGGEIRSSPILVTHRERAIFFPRSTAIRQRHGPFFPFRSRSRGFGYGDFQSLQLALWLCFDGNGEGPRRLRAGAR